MGRPATRRSARSLLTARNMRMWRGSAFPVATPPPQPTNTTSGALQRTFSGGEGDAFLSKLSSDGSSLLVSTFLGGSGSDTGEAVAIDSANQVYVAGVTTSKDLAVTSNAVQRTPDSANCDFQEGTAFPCSDAF